MTLRLILTLYSLNTGIMRRRYVIRPLDVGYSYSYESLHAPPGALIFPTKNLRIDQHSVQKRWGYSEDRDLGASIDTSNIAIYEMKDGTRNTMYLSAGNLHLKETGGSNTWSYKTDTYTTGTVTNITAAVVTGSGTSWDTSGLAAGDKFIADADHSAAIEEDAQLAEILTVDGATQITLTASYGGTTGAMSDTYKGRKVYTTPSNERWAWAVVDDKFCFTNGNSNVQKWTGTGYASDLDATNAIKARYCIEYANRLVLADLSISGTRDPLMVQWSKEGDPTDWTDSTAGQNQLLKSEDHITGMAKLGPNLIVYKRNSLTVASRTGVSTSPIIFPIHRPGVGAYAPYGIIEAMGTNAFLGEHDFYVLKGDYPVSIGEEIRDFFFEQVPKSNVVNTVGFAVEDEFEFHWLATTTSNGQLDFVYSMKNERWLVYDYGDTMNCGGRGAL